MEDAPASPDEARGLRERLAQLDAEIRGYPQPIARCDAQLGGLIEERAALRSRLERITGSPAAR